MGLMVHSLEGIPEGHHRDYFIYLLDYGWREPLSDALRQNFEKMATLASQEKNTVVVTRTEEGIHFSDEVLSWHSINGDNVESKGLLPAILITNRHPSEFRKRAFGDHRSDTIEKNLKMILFPLRKYCEDTVDVVDLIQRIFGSIKQKKDLEDFGIVEEKRKDNRGTLVPSLVIEPTAAGTRIAFDKIDRYFTEK
jgi:hypothetical protein